jgi:hypothetical protein
MTAIIARGILILLCIGLSLDFVEPKVYPVGMRLSPFLMSEGPAGCKEDRAIVS